MKLSYSIPVHMYLIHLTKTPVLKPQSTLLPHSIYTNFTYRFFLPSPSDPFCTLQRNVLSSLSSHLHFPPSFLLIVPPYNSPLPFHSSLPTCYILCFHSRQHCHDNAATFGSHRGSMSHTTRIMKQPRYPMHALALFLSSFL